MTTRHTIKHCFAAASSLAVACATGHTHAATPANYPIKPIRLVVPFAAGGGTDIMARAIGARYSEVWNQPAIVDNRAGGGGNIGTEIVARAPSDGHTLLFNTNTNIVANTPAEFAAVIKDDYARWAGVIKAAGVKVE